jgi:hypothetical protein
MSAESHISGPGRRIVEAEIGRREENGKSHAVQSDVSPMLPPT